MLKKRIIPKFLIRGGRLVKLRRFDENQREAGNPVSTAKVYDSYGIDELIIVIGNWYQIKEEAGWVVAAPVFRHDGISELSIG